MRRLLSLFVGLGMGIAAGVAAVTFFSPVRGDELRQNLRDHYQQALESARKASEQRRTELERELAEMAESS